jgi:hypothetical protein
MVYNNYLELIGVLKFIYIKIGSCSYNDIQLFFNQSHIYDSNDLSTTLFK